MVLAKQEETLETVLGAAVYTESRQLVGFIFEVCPECVGISLCGGVLVWLGKPMITAVEGRSVFLAGNLMRKHPSVHMGIHIHPEDADSAKASRYGSLLLSQAT